MSQRLQDLRYNVADWDDSGTRAPQIVKDALSTASKKQNGNAGFPDRIYCNTSKKLLILVEEKANIKDHDLQEIDKGAIAGVKWYLERFLNSNLGGKSKKRFDTWKILGIAVSGDLSDEYGHKFDCFLLDTSTQRILSLKNKINNFVTENEFLAVFNNLDEEKAVTSVSASSKKINNLLRNIDSQKRPVLLSALMICLYQNANYVNNFPNIYRGLDGIQIVGNVFITIDSVLKQENISQEKITVFKKALGFLDIDQTLQSSDILKEILIELEDNVITLLTGQFATSSNYDIIGKFYEEFLKYAGISNVKKGIVLTPRHITTLFTKLVDLRDNDKIVDLCCGTGAFLIAGMNAIINKISKSGRTDKADAIAKVKSSQLLGFELNPTMFICAISNMLFRGDGKSSIYNYDSINEVKAQEELDKFQPTIGFINPPYGGKENKENPTPKEITFIKKMLDNCSRYGVVIAPLSTYFKDDAIRTSILTRHKLKCVINMPHDLFQPNASTHTAIAVFETNNSFDYEKDEVAFYDLREDGFVLQKDKGRTDIYNKWIGIEKDLLDSVKDNKKAPNDTTFVKTRIKPNDEWTIYGHSKIDYSTLSEENFIKSISEYSVFLSKRGLGILDKTLTESELIESVISYYGADVFVKKLQRRKQQLNTDNWQEFKLDDYFIVNGSTTTPKIELETTYGVGDYTYVTTQSTNNGVAGFFDHNTEKANVLTIDSAVAGYVAYQDTAFTASDHVEVLTPKFDNFDQYIAMFIKTIIMKGQYKYDYGRKFNQGRIKNTILLLPAIINPKSKKPTPDWDNMREIIQSLPYADLI